MTAASLPDLNLYFLEQSKSTETDEFPDKNDFVSFREKHGSIPAPVALTHRKHGGYIRRLGPAPASAAHVIPPGTSTWIERVLWRRATRRSIEYALAVAIALLCSYWIVQGPP